jgi:hypothetical protein
MHSPSLSSKNILSNKVGDFSFFRFPVFPPKLSLPLGYVGELGFGELSLYFAIY